MNEQRLFLHSELALAAYGRNLSSGIPDPEKLGPGSGNAGMAAYQAQRFISSGWTVVEQFNDTTGASATIFQDSAGHRYLAVRGTELAASDLLADGILAAVGIPLLNPQFLALQTRVSQWIQDGVLPASFTVAGHSLGGYLAAALKSRFSQVSEAFIFNAPGNWGVLGTIYGLVESLPPTGEPGAGGVWNVKGSEGLSLIAGLGSPQSAVVSVQIEAASDIVGNHSMARLADALAVQSLYKDLFPQATLSQLNAVINSAETTGKKLEAALDALRVLVFGVSLQPTSVENRDALYQNIYAVQSSSSFADFKAQGLSFIQLTPQTSMAAAALTGDVSMQFALETLSPFIVVGAALPSFPARSSEYWAAREMLLQRKLWFSENDIDPATPTTPTGSEGGSPLHQFQAENTYFQDVGAGYTISQGPALNSTTRYVFAADNGDTVTGAGVADFLFGGAGNDLLFGNYGSDLLDGFEGDDVLDGGQGADILRGGDGND